MKEGIYVVEVDDGDQRARINRYIIVAATATDAVWRCVKSLYPKATRAKFDFGRTSVGRLGDYDPGIEGASMSRGTFIAVQRIGQR